MNGFENPFPSPQPPSMPGRVIISRQPWTAPLTGELYQIIKVTQTYEVDEVIRTEEIGRHVQPSLADGTTPPDTSFLRQCNRCLKSVSSWNTFICKKCHQEFCRAEDIDEGDYKSEYEQVPGQHTNHQKTGTCKDCDQKEKGGIIYKVSKWLWE